jgi:hypothetical protein
MTLSRRPVVERQTAIFPPILIAAAKEGTATIQETSEQ